MAWGHPRNMGRTLDAGGGRGGGGGGSFAPSPAPSGPVPPGRTRPPGAAPANAGRPRAGGWTYPRLPHAKTSKPFSPWFQQLLARKTRIALKSLEWLMPDAAIGEAGGWQIPAGWIQCPTPDCVDVWGAPDYGIWASASTCSAQAPCPGGQAGGSWNTTRRVWGDEHPTRRLVLGYVHTSGNHTDASFRGTIVCQFVRPADLTVPMPEFKVGTVFLPEQFEYPWAEPNAQYQPEIAYGGKPKVGAATGIRSAAKPGVEFAPGGAAGGVPIVHLPVPPLPGDKERKEPPFAYGFPGKLYGALTEAGDAARCYVEAKGGDPKGLGTRGAFREAWRLANDPDAPAMDHRAFMRCITLASAGDAAVGALKGGAARAMNKSPVTSKRPGGYRGGSWGTRMR